MFSLLHTMAVMSGMPADQRDAWRALFDCFAFQREGHPGTHLPADLRDVMGKLSSEDRDQIIAIIAKNLQR